MTDQQPDRPTRTFSRWRWAALYFGLADEAGEDRRVPNALPHPSLARLVVSILIAAVMGGALFGVADNSAPAGVIFGIAMAICLAGLDARRRRARADAIASARFRDG